MADRPILFSAPMVRALLDGRKTQTRRIFKGAEQNENGLWHIHNAGGGVIGVAEEDVGKQAVDYLPIQVGDRLWVREEWSGDFAWHSIKPSERHPSERLWFWADGNPADGDWERPRPSIHMPRWASRLTLTVTDVRVERLQDISEDDAAAEGWPAPEDRAKAGIAEIRDAYPIGWYAWLWDSINGPGAWEANPWVAAYTFTVIQKNISEVRDVAA